MISLLKLLLIPFGFFIIANVQAVPYTYLSGSAPNSYTDSGNELQDGYFPAAYNTNVAEWVGAGPSKHLKPIFNFGQQITLGSLQVFAHSGSAGIGMPQGIAVSFSDDGVNFSNTQTYNTPSSFISADQFPSGLTGSLDFILSGSASNRTAQYIMVDVYNSGNYWIFLGEISFATALPVPEANSVFFLVSGILSVIAYQKYRS